MVLRVSKEGRRVGSADMIQRQNEKGDAASGRDGEGANLRSPDATHLVNQYPSPRRPLARSPSRPLAASVLLFGFFLLPFAFAQSGRQTPPPPKPQPPSQSQG